MPGSFEIPASQLFISPPRGVKCPECGSENVEVEWRDSVWEETGYRCLQDKCWHRWIKG